MALQHSVSDSCLLMKFMFNEWFHFIDSFNVNLSTVLCLLTVILIGIFLYWIYFVPLSWTKELTEVGYGFITKNIRSKSAKIFAINQSRKLRKANSNNMPPPFPNGWFAIVESKNVKCGQVVSVSCLGENFAVFRAENGKIHVVDAYCPHLGANIAVGGIVRGDCIECPFHLWSFRGSDGQCVNAAYSSTESGFKNSKIKTWISTEINGAVFVWHHVESTEPWSIPLLKEIETADWIYQARNEYFISCHIQEIPENGADVAHLIAVHGSNILTGSDLRYTRAAWGAFLNHWWDASWRVNSNPEKKHQAIATLEHSTRIFNKFEIHHLDIEAHQIGPGYVFLEVKSSLGTVGILQTVTPVEPMLQKVIHRFYAPRKASILAKFLFWAECVMFERDMMVWNHKIYLNSPCLLKEDRNIKLYRNWFSQFYSPNSKTFAQARESMEW